MNHLFTYGTLTFPKVMETLTGRSFASAEGVVQEFAGFLLKDRLYPGMTVVKGEHCSGRIYFHVDDRSLTILDDFEDKVYVRQLIQVNTHDGQSFEAYAYLIPPKDRACLTSLPLATRPLQVSPSPSIPRRLQNLLAGRTGTASPRTWSVIKSENYQE